MPVTDSPLRYPGGKTKIYTKIRKLIDINMDKGERIYIEPYAGGAGLALKLLYSGDVDKLVLNDFDYHIYCFWKSCLENSGEFCKILAECDVNITEWNRQKEIYENEREYSQLAVGFSTFFLNRCNVSGIIKGGPIGGRSQSGTYKMDARFNKDGLIKKIKKIASYSKEIQFYNMDAVCFLKTVVPFMDNRKVFLNIDPPYVKKGPMLYKNSYTVDDHKQVAQEVARLLQKWVVTYDECELIQRLYQNFRMECMSLNYSAGCTKLGQEYIIYSDSIKMENTYDRKIGNS